MSEIMDAHVFQTRRLADARPRLLKVYEMGAILLTANDKGVAIDAGDVGQGLQCWCRQINDFFASFGLG